MSESNGLCRGRGVPGVEVEIMRIRMLALVAIAPVVFGVAACGPKAGGDGIASAGGGTAKASASASPTQSLSPADAALKFAQCMRQNGVQMADPDTSGGGVGIKVQSNPSDRTKMEAAMKKCQQFTQAGGKLGNADDPKVRDQMLKFAQCMRQHGVQMADPKPGEGITLSGKPGSEAKMQAAQKACQQYAPGQGGPSSQGGGSH
jgi:hypothetical protein